MAYNARSIALFVFIVLVHLMLFALAIMALVTTYDDENTIKTGQRHAINGLSYGGLGITLLTALFFFVGLGMGWIGATG